MCAAILDLQFPFELKKDQVEAVQAWMQNGMRGSVIFSTGTGKTEIAFECARRAAGLAGARPFKTLILVPRIVLVEQNVRRLAGYKISQDRIGTYYGERKQVREITVATYQSAVNNPELIRWADMVVLDEIHMISETASEYDRLFDVVIEDPRRAILGLTATIDESDPKYNTILTIAPPVKRYMIREAVIDGRLARPVVMPEEVKFTPDEQKRYDEATANIKDISRKLRTYDPIRMSKILARGGMRASLAKQWFAHVHDRKNLLSSTQQKMLKAVEIAKRHPRQRVMIFSETIESIERLKTMLESEGVSAQTIHNGIKPKERAEILQRWGDEFFALLSVHTLEIGYDVPQVGIAIIIASTSNMNQVAQRIGRVVRIAEGKDHALVYVICVAGSKDTGMLKIISAAIEKGDKPVTRSRQGRRPSEAQKTITRFS